MSITLAYPDLAAPTTQIILPDVEQLPSSRPTRKLQTVFETSAGTSVVYDFGSQREVFTLQLYPLNAAQAAAVKSFFNDTVNGQAITWWIRDSFDDEYNVRFAQDVIEPMQRHVSAYAVTVTVRVI